MRTLEVHPAIDPRSGQARGVSPLPPYVRRGHDQELCDEVEQAVHRSRAVVLVGDSSTGKTRALWEAIQRLPDGWRVWRPSDRSSLLTGLAGHRSLARTVLWLNEAQRYLIAHRSEEGENAAAALTDLLNTPQRGPVLVLGTLWRDGHALLAITPVSQYESDPHAQARALLAVASVIPVAESFGEEELARLAVLAADDARLEEALETGRTRITQYLAGARELIRRYELAPPEARALMDAAADARRLGHGPALPPAFLQAAARTYLGPQWLARTDQWRHTWFTSGTGYTGHPCRGVPGPLVRDAPVTGAAASVEPPYRMADYLVQHTAGARRWQVPPPGFWDAAAEHLSNTEDLIALADSACSRLRLRHAESLYRRAAGLGDSHALVCLGIMRENAGDRPGAKAVQEQAARAGNHLGWAYLIRLVDDEGDQERAERLAATAAGLGFTDGLLNLAAARENAELWQAAERLYQQAADAGDPDAPRYAARSRARAEGRDDFEEFPRRSADRGPGPALQDEGYQLELAGDRQGAERLYQQAVAAGHFSCLGSLARMREEDGDQQGAERLALQAAAHGWSLVPALLAGLRADDGDHEGAERLAQAAVARGSTAGLMQLARTSERDGEQQRAVELYERAAAAGDTSALQELVRMREQAGDEPGAERLARQAADAGDAGPLLELARTRPGDGWRGLPRYGLEADGRHSPPWTYGPIGP
ncbi:hypothetical protein [Streptomyces luteogriseus]|uniref:hypothetical protein n=1 Tax=Streptomyces luteogriseus TaxID=68233 RepID=UPI0036C5A175